MRTSDELAQECGDSRNQIHRYIRLTNLVPELLDYVDEGRIKMRPAVELSFLDEDSQRDVVDEIDLNDATPSHDQTIRMRRLLFGHAFDINDGEFEVHHPELAVDTDPIEEIMLKDNIKRLREVLCYLSETQKRRVFKYFFYNKTLEKIADEEGVDFTSVRESVNSAIKKLRKFF